MLEFVLIKKNSPKRNREGSLGLNSWELVCKDEDRPHLGLERTVVVLVVRDAAIVVLVDTTLIEETFHANLMTSENGDSLIVVVRNLKISDKIALTRVLVTDFVHTVLVATERSDRNETDTVVEGNLDQLVIVLLSILGREGRGIDLQLIEIREFYLIVLVELDSTTSTSLTKLSSIAFDHSFGESERLCAHNVFLFHKADLNKVVVFALFYAHRCVGSYIVYPRKRPIYRGTVRYVKELIVESHLCLSSSDVFFIGLSPVFIEDVGFSDIDKGELTKDILRFGDEILRIPRSSRILRFRIILSCFGIEGLSCPLVVLFELLFVLINLVEEHCDGDCVVEFDGDTKASDGAFDPFVLLHKAFGV